MGASKTLLGAVYSNLGDWGSIQESLQKAAKFGESLVGTFDVGLLAYVCLVPMSLTFTGKFDIRVRHD
jgi:hypothetical protein